MEQKLGKNLLIKYKQITQNQSNMGTLQVSGQNILSVTGSPATATLNENVRVSVNASKGVSATTVISGTSHYDRIKITADYLTLIDNNNFSILTPSVDVTAIITNSGANGFRMKLQPITYKFSLFIFSLTKNFLNSVVCLGYSPKDLI